MVAKIVIGESIRGMLQYNENKVTQGQAQLIMASGFATDIAGMSMFQKLQRFEHLTILNSKANANAIHISLNFDNMDKVNNQKLQQITNEYMERIGFGDQPYLVYKHLDAAHAHVHIATTNIKANGKRIETHNIGKIVSEPARKALEIKYNLIQAEGRKTSNSIGIIPIDIEKAIYGKVPTKGKITSVVNAVIGTYKFTSLVEFNAVLRQFNIVASRGKEDTIMYQKNGLIYNIINQQGDPVGVPIKASSIYNKPTLKKLQDEFQINVEKRKPYRIALKNTIDKVLKQFQTITQETLAAKLEIYGVNMVTRQNDQGYIYGITFIDNKQKVVFNGSALGKDYSAKAITDRISTVDKLLQLDQKTYLKPVIKTNYLKQGPSERTFLRPPEAMEHIQWISSKDSHEYAPMIRKRRKKRKKGHSQESQQSI